MNDITLFIIYMYSTLYREDFVLTQPPTPISPQTTQPITILYWKHDDLNQTTVYHPYIWQKFFIG